jgi:hypothetical protein
MKAVSLDELQQESQALLSVFRPQEGNVTCATGLDKSSTWDSSLSKDTMVP